MPVLASVGGSPSAPPRPWDADFVPAGTVEIRLTAPRSTLPFPRGWFLAGLATLATLLSLRFVIAGAWPVLLFSLLDVAGLAVAFVLFDRGAVPEERLRVGDGTVELIRRDERGRSSTIRLPLFGTRVEIACRSEVDCRLWLAFREQRHPVGTCISVDERRAALPRIEAALAAARH